MQSLQATILRGAAAAGGLWAISQAAYVVPPGKRALIFDHLNNGTLPGVKNEGLNFLIPFKQYPIIVDARTTPRKIPMVTGTKDLQMVNLSLRLLYRPQVDHLQQIVKTSGKDFADRILPSVTNEVVKAVVAQYAAEGLLKQREAISREIRAQLYERCKQFYIELDDVSITDLTFSKDFAKAIEDKQVAEQQAERAKFVVMKAEQERQALVIRSEGDAEAAKVVSEALQKHGKGLIELRRIETAQHIASVLAKNNKVTYLPSSNNGMLLNVPLPVNR